MRKSRFLMQARVLLVFGLVLALLVGCAGGGGSDPGSTGSPGSSGGTSSGSSGSSGTSSGSTGSASKDVVVAGGTITVSMDVHKVSDSPSFTVLEHINETLYTMDENGNVHPLLAEELLQSSADGMTHTIKLRQGITFTDGEPFNAEAVKANFERILNNDLQWKSLISLVTNIETPDEYTVVLTTSAPFAPLQFHLTHGGVAMISPKAIAQGDEWLASNTVGTGPFKQKEYRQDELVVLERNDDYWGTKAKLDTITFKAIKDDGPRMVDIESGNADIAVRIPATEKARLESNPNIDVLTTDTLRILFVYFNVNNPPFDNKLVRQAVNYAVDKEAIVNSLLGGAGRPQDAPMTPAIFGYSAQTPYAYDPDKARELLQQAGVAPGTKVTLHHPTGRYPQDAQVAEAIAAQLAEVGLDVELKTEEWANYLEVTNKPAGENIIQMAMLGWSTPTMDADYALYNLFHSTQHPPGGFARGFYANPDVDNLLDLGRTTVDQNTRKQHYADAIELIWEDAAWLFLHGISEITAVSKDLSGYVLHPSERILLHNADKN